MITQKPWFLALVGLIQLSWTGLGFWFPFQFDHGSFDWMPGWFIAATILPAGAIWVAVMILPIHIAQRLQEWEEVRIERARVKHE